MERDVFNDGVIVYRNLFTKIIKCNDQSNVRNGYTRYKVFNGNNIIMVFACKDNDNPYQKYIENKNK
jgi:hypothetical protein